ncbi:hypothetical protein [uncultured Jannaschia sp.]|uniref:hypothetical protein n=1 Tax=uncultured Jannaschia sp. TaxID=293347 RepID=UPI00262E5974|nr:hypothetical protein [uncultured Jannaschia sp.]
MTKGRKVPQPTAAPTRKVKYFAGVGGAVAVAMPLLEVFWPGATECIEGARVAVQPLIAIGSGLFAGYMVRERDDPQAAGT